MWSVSWNFINHRVPHRGFPKHLMWYLSLLKNYSTEVNHCTIFGINENLFQKWCCILVGLIANMNYVSPKKSKIVPRMALDICGTVSEYEISKSKTLHFLYFAYVCLLNAVPFNIFLFLTRKISLDKRFIGDGVYVSSKWVNIVVGGKDWSVDTVHNFDEGWCFISCIAQELATRLE